MSYAIILLSFSGVMYVALCHPGEDIFPKRSYKAESSNTNTAEHNSIKNELQEVLMEVRKIDSKDNYAFLLEKIAKVEENVARLQVELYNFDTKGEDATLMKRAGRVNVGTSYVRWGRKGCPGNGSEALYDGLAGGSYYNSYGASTSMVCLTWNPEYGNHNDAVFEGGYIYGTEYYNNKVNLFPDNVYQHDVPCAVCLVKQRSVMIMIPGRQNCYPGWTQEYWGYLMSGHASNKASLQYYCIDAQPETLNYGEAHHNGNFLYFVEGRCGSLACPPYKEGRELTCVVCTK